MTIATVADRPHRFRRAHRKDTFNLNLPRYVSTFDPEERIELKDALRELVDVEGRAQATLTSMTTSLRAILESSQANR